MPNVVTMPKFGQSVEEATVVSWLKQEGDTVSKGDILFEIETDKAVLEVESFYEGTLLKIIVPEGETVPVQATVAFIGEPGEEIPEVKALPKPAKPKKAAQPSPAALKSAKVEAAHAAPQPHIQEKRFTISPRARKLAKDKLITPTKVNGTGPGGRVVERDVLEFLASVGYDSIRITPSAKTLAAKESLDILSIRASDESGKIVVDDVKTAVAEKPKPMSKIRTIIAERLTHSFTSVPHFFVTVAVDLTDLQALRAKLKEQGAKYSVNDFIMKAVTLSLVEFPEVNSTTDGKSTSWHSRVNLGLAVALDGALVVPVIRDADKLGLAQLNETTRSLVAKARDGNLLPDQMQGGTFTISNMGMLDVDNFTAIINPGESAILAVSSVTKQPAVVDDKIEVRSIMKMTISSDHRIIDGAMAARFINAVKNKLEDNELWKNLT